MRLLIDDLTSTGTTLIQAANVLLRHGAAAVYASISHLRGPLCPGLPERRSHSSS